MVEQRREFPKPFVTLTLSPPAPLLFPTAGKGSEGPREELGALWSLATLVAIKVLLVLTGCNFFVMMTGAKVDGALYCEDEGCSDKWLRYQFYSSRISSLVLALFLLCLEVGIPAVVELSGPSRRHWYNGYMTRGVLFFYLGVVTLPDRDWAWCVPAFSRPAAMALPALQKPAFVSPSAAAIAAAAFTAAAAAAAVAAAAAAAATAAVAADAVGTPCSRSLGGRGQG